MNRWRDGGTQARFAATVVEAVVQEPGISFEERKPGVAGSDSAVRDWGRKAAKELSRFWVAATTLFF